MKKNSKIILSVLWCTSEIVFAGEMSFKSNKNSENLWYQKPQWEISGRALYLQPSATTYANSVYGNSVSSTNFITGTNPNWGWGWQLEVAYQFQSGNDIHYNWYHFRNSTTSQMNQPKNLTNFMVVNSFPIDLTTYSNLQVQSELTTVNPQWDQVNIEFGRFLNLGQNDDLRVHGGFNFSRVANSDDTTFIANASEPGASNVSYQINSSNSASYNGFGPRLGLDLYHHLGKNIHAYIDGAMTLLAGSSKFSVVSQDLVGTTPYSGRDSHSRSMVVPEMDAKVGMNYNHTLSQGEMTADLGWLWANYFGCLTCNANNFGIQGLYFGLKWNGQIAS